jgi:NAD(P)-dependent dehydrogenase (short-subunit alcohol dehydrogenase family)
MQLDGIEGRVALVTGGARGIGKCIAETFRDLGARTVAGDLEPPEIEGVLGVRLDVTDERSVDEAFTSVERQLDAVELLICNAGVMTKVTLEETTLAEWQRHLDVNLTGAFLCARRALPAMRGAGYGRIVMLGSSAGITGGPAAPPPLAAYAASKGGIMTLAKAIAAEYASSGVTSNALAPTMIRTEMAANIPDDFVRSTIPIGRMGMPKEIADVTAFLCSAHAGYITGEIVDVNGGFLID